MTKPPKKKKRVHHFQEAWKKGHNWLWYDQESLTRTCSVCSTFFQRKGSRGGHGSDAWIQGCSRLKYEVVVEHEKLKHHRDANAAAEMQAGIVKAGGMFSGQLAQRDEAIQMAMKLLYWLVKHCHGEMVFREGTHEDHRG